MLHIDNETVSAVLTMPAAVDALREGYREYANGEAALVPRVDLWAPAERTDGYYCFGTMAGTSRRWGVTALRVKSDVTYWPEGRTQEKYAARPGLYCGFVLVFDNATGAPLALINDGILQHVRVGAAGGVAIDILGPSDPASLGLLGSGGMATTMLEAAMHVRPFERIRVYSPTEPNRVRFCDRARDRYPETRVEAVGSSTEAIADADVVISATDSMVPTLDPTELPDTVLVLAISRREVGRDRLDAYDAIVQLGPDTYLPHEGMPDMVYPQSGMAGFVAGTDEERRRLPWRLNAATGTHPSLIEILQGRAERPPETGRRLVVSTGTQGIQFATMAGLVLSEVRRLGGGNAFPGEAFLQTIRD